MEKVNVLQTAAICFSSSLRTKQAVIFLCRTVIASVNQKTYDSQSTTSNLRNEMEVLLGKKQMCKILIFAENQQNKIDSKQVVLHIVCAEKFRLEQVVSEKTKIGLIELPKSQSPDRLLKQADEIKIEMKGSVQLDEDIPADAYSLTYLEGSDNYFRFPVNITDYSGKITFIMRLGADNSMLHTFFMTVADLLTLVGKFEFGFCSHVS